MWQLYSKLDVMTLLLIAGSACSKANFGGGARNRQDAEENARRQGRAQGIEEGVDTAKSVGEDGSVYSPITEDLSTGGWVTKRGFPSLGQAINDNPGNGALSQENPLSSPGSRSNGNEPGTSGNRQEVPMAGNNSPGSGPSSGNSSSMGNRVPSISDSGTSPSNPDAAPFGDTNLKNSNIPAWGAGENGVFWVPCNASDNTTRGRLQTADGAKVRVSGELCPEQKIGRLNVLFIVDFSGSMEGNLFEGPHDPRVNGSCGRLRAAEALISKFESGMFTGVEITAGMVAFADNAEIRLPLNDLSRLRSSLTPANWCGSNGATALTNYRAAFEQAQLALRGTTGNTVVYLISDGSPTVGGNDDLSDTDAGLRAAQALRQAGGDRLLLNVVFLGYRNGDAKNPREYLDQVAGSPSQVRLVAAADGLVSAIQSLETTKDLLDLNAIKATLSANSNSMPLQVESLRRSTSRLGAYVYLTSPFALIGKKGEIIENMVTVRGKSRSGQEVESKAIIEFKLMN